MSKVTKKQKTILEKVDPEMTYSMADALEILKSVKSNKFEESVDIAIRLGVDPNKSDQNVRGAVTLPNSLGKEVTVAVFADGDQAEAAKAAGAEHIGMDDLAEKFTKEEITVDVVISTNAAMKVVGKLGQVLGQKVLCQILKPELLLMMLLLLLVMQKLDKLDLEQTKMELFMEA